MAVGNPLSVYLSKKIRRTLALVYAVDLDVVGVEQQRAVGCFEQLLQESISGISCLGPQ